MARSDDDPLTTRENYLRAHRALHTVWSHHKGKPGYEKRLFLALDVAIQRLAREGPGRELAEGEEPR